MPAEAPPSGFVRDVERDLDAFWRRIAEIELALNGTDGPMIPAARAALLAVALHGAYGAVESIFQRIAEQVDGDVPGGSRWHADLLARMAGPLAPIRGAVIDAEAATCLRSLLGFRHFFRHSYGAEFDMEQLESHGSRLLAHAEHIDAQIRAFCGLSHRPAAGMEPGR